MNKKLPQRKHPSKGVLYFESNPTIMFDTVCTKGRNSFLDNNEVHELLTEIWKETKGWIVGRYVLMPDHIHFFAGATEPFIEYENWVRYWKSQFTKRYEGNKFYWQANHWDRRMRDEEQYEEKWLYVLQNPVRHGLVSDADNWKFKGELNNLRWS